MFWNFLYVSVVFNVLVLIFFIMCNWKGIEESIGGIVVFDLDVFFVIMVFF